MDIAPLLDHMNFIDELAQLHQAEWAHLSSLPTAESRKNALADAAGRSGIPSIYIAYDGNELIGSAALIEHDLESHPDLSPWLAAVYVREKWRGRGIATLLVEYCEAEARRVGVKSLYLSTQFATKLYASLGWEIIECCQYRGTALDVMRKNLVS